MIRIQNRILQLSVHGDHVHVTVTYTVVFDQIDRMFAANGVIYRERLTMLGMDGNISSELPGAPQGQYTSTGWTNGVGQQTQVRTRNFIMSRADLNEDPGVFQNEDDEIRCQIEIIFVNTPSMPSLTSPTLVGLTNEVVLSLVLPPLP